jgi:hypothetical protein
MKIVFLPEFDDLPPGAGGPAAGATPEPDRVAGRAYTVEVPAAVPTTTTSTTTDRFSDTEWSAFMDLS